MPHPDVIYKIVTTAVYEEAMAEGQLTGMPIDLADGYIHFSTAAQLTATLAKHFAGQSGLIVMAVKAADLGSELRWEPARGGDLFPHLYKSLPMPLISWTIPVSVSKDGTTSLPWTV